MSENVHDTSRSSDQPVDPWAAESLLIELELPVEFSWSRLAETRLEQFEAALTDEVPEYCAEDEEAGCVPQSFNAVDEVYIVISEES